MDGAPEQHRLDDVLRDRLVCPAYQPVVDLDRDVVVGYEALARGPVGALQGPDVLFAAARSEQRLVELDWLCREQAVNGARRAGLRYPLSLFVNAEPETLLASFSEAERWRAFSDLRCYAELTERALAATPATLLRAVEQVRGQDWGIAVDDVGADPASLALLPLLRPDVIKLDLRLLQQAPRTADDIRVAQVLHAALRQAQDTGAVVVAEGIETEAHLDLARAYGVDYGQGYLLGRPAPLPCPLVSPSRAVPLLHRPLDRSVPPGAFTAVTSALPTRRLERSALREVARQLLAQAVHVADGAVVLLCVSDRELLPDGSDSLLDRLSGAPLLAVLGDPPALPASGALRTWRLRPDDPGCADFDVVVVSPHFSAALVARPAMPAGPSGAMDAVLTFDRDLVAGAARALAARLVPEDLVALR